MGSNSDRRSGSSARSTGRKRVVIGAEETVRVRYKKDRPEVETERRASSQHRERNAPRAPKSAGARAANVKRDERERRQRSIARRRLLIWAGIAVLAAGAVWGIFALARAPIFSIAHVRVTGTAHLTPEQVGAMAAVPSGATLLRLPSRQITQRVESSPWVRNVRLVRHFPDTLEIAVTERVPVAIVDAGGTSLWLVSGDGYWLAKRTAETSTTAPTIRDIEGLAPAAGERSPSPELANALAVLGGLSPQLLAQVRTVSAPSIDRTALILPHGVQVFIGSAQDIAKKDEVARAIISQNKNVVYVNVRVVNRPTWRGLNSGN